MRVREIFRADILNPASETESNWRYVLVNPDSVDTSDYLTPSASLDKLVASTQAQNTFVDVQFPDRRGIFFDGANNVAYSYQPVSGDDQFRVALRLKKYTKP
ncbi:MAG: hypothetical protein Q8R53_03290 [Nanoarchaeota archaeon]|nr:hypothetical protein [Nanoarchaeota archaeon]